MIKLVSKKITCVNDLFWWEEEAIIAFITKFVNVREIGVVDTFYPVKSFS